MLADHAEPNVRARCDVDHPPRGLEVYRHRFLHLYVLARCCRCFNGLQAEIRHGADVYIVDGLMAADVLIARNRFAAVFCGEPPCRIGNDVSTEDDRESDAAVDARVKVSDGDRSY